MTPLDDEALFKLAVWAFQYNAYVENQIRIAVLQAFYLNVDTAIVQVHPAPWDLLARTVVYHLGDQQRIYL